MVDTKKNVVNTRQLVSFGAIVIYLMISNLDEYGGLPTYLNIAITLGVFIFVMLLKQQEGIPQLSDLFKSLIDIFVKNESNDEKMRRLESVVALIMNELGELYTDERERFFNYLKGIKSDGVITNEEMEGLKAEIARLEAIIKGDTNKETT